MPELTLEQGPLRYADTGGGGSPVVLVHGLLVDGTLWRDVVAGLAGQVRVLVPELPLGSHRLPMRPDADLSPPGVARLIADFLVALDLRGVTLVGNDTGGAMCQLVLTAHPERVDSWLTPITRDPGIRRDLRKVLRGIHPRHTLAAAARLRGFAGPALVVWGRRDRFFTPAHARRLAAEFGDARLEWVDEARTFVPIDAPARLSALIADFVRRAAASR